MEFFAGGYEMEKSQGDYEGLYANIGHLITAFAALENALLAAIKLPLMNNINEGLNDKYRATKLAGAIYGGMRFKACRDTIKRVLRAENASKKITLFVNDIFSHIGHIEDLRDKIAHQQIVRAHPDMSGQWELCDVAITRDMANMKFYVFDSSIVYDAASDIELSTALLCNAPMTNRLFDSISDFSPPSWRYKSYMLKFVKDGELKTLR